MLHGSRSIFICFDLVFVTNTQKSPYREKFNQTNCFSQIVEKKKTVFWQHSDFQSGLNVVWFIILQCFCVYQIFNQVFDCLVSIPNQWPLYSVPLDKTAFITFSEKHSISIVICNPPFTIHTFKRIKIDVLIHLMLFKLLKLKYQNNRNQARER